MNDCLFSFCFFLPNFSHLKIPSFSGGMELIYLHEGDVGPIAAITYELLPTVLHCQIRFKQLWLRQLSASSFRNSNIPNLILYMN